MATIFESIVNDNNKALSELMETRTKIDMDMLISDYHGDITITCADIVELEGNPVAILVCEQEPNSFFFGGAALTKIVNDWLTAFDDDVKAMNAELAKTPCMLHCEKCKTKKGRTYTRVSMRA